MNELKASSSTSALRADSDKVLGRGLEDVSRLILSQLAKHEPKRPVKEPANHSAVEPSSSPSPAPAASVPLMLRLAAPITGDRLETLLKQLDGAIESGLTLIDGKVPCARCDPIDLVAVDRDGRFTIIDFDTRPNDQLLLRGVGHFDWVVENILNIRRMYAGHAIQFALQPRVVLLAPDFSWLFRAVLRQMAHPHLECVKYQLVEIPSTLGVLFEPVGS